MEEKGYDYYRRTPYKSTYDNNYMTYSMQMADGPTVRIADSIQSEEELRREYMRLTRGAFREREYDFSLPYRGREMPKPEKEVNPDHCGVTGCSICEGRPPEDKPEPEPTPEPEPEKDDEPTAAELLAEDIGDLIERVQRASSSLNELILDSTSVAEKVRLRAKREGVELVLSHIMEQFTVSNAA